MPPLTSDDETARLEALHGLALLDTSPEAAFDDLTTLAAEICGTPLALVTLVDARRQWFKAAIGTELTETPREVAFCAHAIEGDDLFVVPDALKDARFAQNPLVTGALAVRFYAGAPLRTRRGHALGTLCVLDREPRELRPGQLAALRALGRQAEAQLELRARLREVAAQRDAIGEILAQRDRLTRFLMHDLNNQLMVVANSAYVLLHGSADRSQEDAASLQAIADGTLRLRDLAGHALDFRGLSGSEMPVRRSRFELDELLAEVVRYGAPTATRATTVHVSPTTPAVWADRALLGRVVGNLVDNARKYGGGRVVVLASAAPHGGVALRVEDDGPGVRAADRVRIFEPHVRLAWEGVGPAPDGRGLGLAFCYSAVQAHGGRLWVEDVVPHGSAFCIELPGR